MRDATSRSRPRETAAQRRGARTTARVIAVLAVLGALGALVMAIGHLGVDLPAAPGPGRMILPVAIGFFVGTALFTAVAYGTLRASAWAWPVAVVVNGLAFVSAMFPFRGWMSAIAGAVTAVALWLLLSPSGRRELNR